MGKSVVVFDDKETLKFLVSMGHPTGGSRYQKDMRVFYGKEFVKGNVYD